MLGRKSIRDNRLLRDVQLASHTCREFILRQEYSEQKYCSPCDDNDNVNITQRLHYATITLTRSPRLRLAKYALLVPVMAERRLEVSTLGRIETTLLTARFWKMVPAMASEITIPIDCPNTPLLNSHFHIPQGKKRKRAMGLGK